MSIIDITPPEGYEIGFQNTIDFENKRFCFKYEYGEGGKRCLLAGDDKEVMLKWLMNLPLEKRRMYELIRENDLVAEFYDIDFKINSSMTNAQVEEMSFNIIQELLDARNEVEPVAKLSRKEIIVLSAHTPTKLSLHIISKRTFFENNRVQSVFGSDVYNYLSTHSKFGVNIDTSVYSKNRCFRLFQSSKFGKENPLVVFHPELYSFASMNDTFVVLTHQDRTHKVKIVKYSDEDIYIRQHQAPAEILTNDLNELLVEFAKEHPYLQVLPNNRINRVQHTSRPCLTNPSDTHSTENMFWYIKSNKIYVACFCLKGKHICLGGRTTVSRVNVQPEPFSFGTHKSCDFKDYSDLGEFNTLFDKRRTGKGKTTCALKFTNNFKRVLLVHHRLSLDDDYIHKYPDFISYQEETNADKQTVCLNSLHKIDVMSYDLIVMDEIRSLLKQTEMPHMVFATNSLFNIFENTNVPIVMLDANMTENDVKFIQKFRKDPTAVVIHDKNEFTDKDVYVYPEPEFTLEDMICGINQTIQQGQKVVLIYNRSIESMNALLNGYQEKYRVLHINRYTRKNICMNDKDKWYDNYDIIAYSPTISEGVSFEDSRFENVRAYGLFISTSCPAESVSQMIARFRAMKEFHIHIDCKRKKEIPLLKSRSQVIDYINVNIRTMTSLNVERKEGKLEIIQDDFFELYAKNLLEQSCDYHNYSDIMIQKLVNNGYNVYYAPDCALNNVSDQDIVFATETFPELKSKERLRIVEGIQTAPDLSETGYRIMNEGQVDTEEDQFKIQKYDIRKSINVVPEHLTCEMIDRFKSYQMRNVLNNIKSCFVFSGNGSFERMPMNSVIQTMSNDMLDHISQKASFGSQKRSITQFRTSKLIWLNHTAQDLGFDGLLSEKPILQKEFDQRLEQLLHIYQSNYTVYKETCSLFNRPASKKRQESLTSKFILSIFSGFLKVAFVKTQVNGIPHVIQQVDIPMKFYDEFQRVPNLMGSVILPTEVARKYECLFKGVQVPCRICGEMVYESKMDKHMGQPSHWILIEEERRETKRLEQIEKEAKEVPKRIITEEKEPLQMEEEAKEEAKEEVKEVPKRIIITGGEAKEEEEEEAEEVKEEEEENRHWGEEIDLFDGNESIHSIEGDFEWNETESID